MMRFTRTSSRLAKASQLGKNLSAVPGAPTLKDTVEAGAPSAPVAPVAVQGPIVVSNEAPVAVQGPVVFSNNTPMVASVPGTGRRFIVEFCTCPFIRCCW